MAVMFRTDKKHTYIFQKPNKFQLGKKIHIYIHHSESAVHERQRLSLKQKENKGPLQGDNYTNSWFLNCKNVSQKTLEENHLYPKEKIHLLQIQCPMNKDKIKTVIKTTELATRRA